MKSTTPVTPVFAQIYEVVCSIPAGRVASYGQVAKACGLFRGARLVGWALKALRPDSPVPWQRVINREGVISIVNPAAPPQLQGELLEKEGVTVVEEEGRLRVVDPPWYEF